MSQRTVKSFSSPGASLLVLGLDVGDAGVDLGRLLGRDLLVAGPAVQRPLVRAHGRRVQLAVAGDALEAPLVELLAVWNYVDCSK